MTSEYTSQVAVGLLLLSLLGVLVIGLLASLWMFASHRRTRSVDLPSTRPHPGPKPVVRYSASVFEQPCRWAVVKTSRMSAVQAALGLKGVIPCSWGEGLTRLANHKLFVSAPIRGWIMIIGHGLPDPLEDPDQCFHFILKISRSLGHVQLYSVNRALNYHAWARAEGGQIRRAYAWAGETLWNQGPLSSTEKELRLKCWDYGEKPAPLEPDAQGSNSDKLMALAARWSFDPTAIDDQALPVGLGVAGELSHSKQH